MPRSKGSKSSKKSNKQPIQKITPIHQPDRNGLKDKEETGEAYSLLNNKRLLNKYRDEISSEEDEFDKDYFDFQKK